MDIQKMTDYLRVKVSKSELQKLKDMSDVELLDYTWVPSDRLDHVERNEDYVYVADRGIDINGQVIDNSVIFTTQEFEKTQRDQIFQDYVFIDA